MGITLLPEITSNEAIVEISTTADMSKEDSYDVAGQVVEALMAVDHVEEVGITTDTSVAGIDVGQLGLPKAITDLLNAANSYGSYKINVKLDESLSSTQIETARQALEDALGSVENCTGTVEISGMQELTSMMSNGLSVKVYGPDTATITQLPIRSWRWSTTPRALPTPPPAWATATPPLSCRSTVIRSVPMA